MKKLKFVLFLLVISLISIPTSAELNLNKANFSSEVELNETYEWNIENYQVGDRRIDYKSSPTSFEFVHGSDIELTILQDPSEIDLASRSNLSDATNFTDFFELNYDNIDYNWDKSDPLFIWFFPISGITTNGESIDLLDEFWIYNLYNLLRNGETLNFNSTLPDGSLESQTSDDEQTLTLAIGDEDLQARIDSKTGIMNSVNFVSPVNDFRIEINRRGSGGSSALPIAPVWALLPLILIPVVISYLRKR